MGSGSFRTDLGFVETAAKFGALLLFKLFMLEVITEAIQLIMLEVITEVIQLFMLTSKLEVVHVRKIIHYLIVIHVIIRSVCILSLIKKIEASSYVDKSNYRQVKLIFHTLIFLN